LFGAFGPSEAAATTSFIGGVARLAMEVRAKRPEEAEFTPTVPPVFMSIRA